jgi:hypothetical protein
MSEAHQRRSYAASNSSANAYIRRHERGQRRSRKPLRMALGSLGALITLAVMVDLGTLAPYLEDMQQRFGVDDQPVVVIIVSSPKSVSSVRRAVDRDRVVASVETGFALGERRIIASNYAAVGLLLQQTGWNTANLEIYNSSPKEHQTEASINDERLAALMDKPTLNRLEAHYVLNRI